MRGRGRDSGLRFNVANGVESEAIDKIRPRPMVGDDLRPLVRGHRGVPPLFGIGQPFVEVAIALGEICLIGRGELTELVSNRSGNLPAVAGIEPVMRISGRVDVAHRPRDLTGWNLENLDVI